MLLIFDVFCGKMFYSLKNYILDIVAIPVDFRSSFWWTGL